MLFLYQLLELCSDGLVQMMMNVQINIFLFFLNNVPAI